MKGIVFNVVEESVTEAHGASAWEDILDAADLDGAYTSLGTYPDEHMTRIVGAGSDALGVPEGPLLRDLGRSSLGRLALRFPDFFTAYPSTRPFLLALNDVIHTEVRKLYPEADVPHFAIDATDPDVVELGYDSHRRMCHLAEGFVLGAADHYGERAEVEQTTCMLRGDDRCTLRCRFFAAQ